MSPLELRASAGLAGLYALRMLGMFLLMPVFTLYAQHLPGGNNIQVVSFAFGVYGLTQALLLLPLGMLSDRIGRKPVIFGGLVVLAIGSVVAAMAHDIVWIAIGRAIQGAGAISSAIVALIADLTTEENRTKAMAMIGGSIGTTFAVSLIIAPTIAHWIGLSGIFWLMAILACAAIVGVWLIIPTPVHSGFHSDAEANPKRLPVVLRDGQLCRLNYGVFALHAGQMALFVTLPLVLERTTHLPAALHWHVYLPVMAIGFALMVPAVIVAETRNRLKQIFVGAIALILVSLLGLALQHATLGSIVLWLTLYFTAFNVLEATQPSIVSKVAPADAKGTAMGVYNTSQALGLTIGSSVSGLLYAHGGAMPVYIFCACLMAVWLLTTLGLRPPLPVRTVMLRVDPARLTDALALSQSLACIRGIKEAVVIAEEGVAYLKVLREGWDEDDAKRLLGLA